MRSHRAVAFGGLAVACCSTTPDHSRASAIAWQQPVLPRAEQTVALPDGARVEYVTGNDGFGWPVGPQGEFRHGSIRCVDASGTVRWSLTEPDLPSQPTDSSDPAANPLAGAFYVDYDAPRDPPALSFGEAALAADAAHLYVVQFCSLSPGASVVALDLATGDVDWSTWVTGLGPVWHSRYANVVGARIVDATLVVFGDESGGDYIEVFAADGTMLSTYVLPPR